MRICLSLQISRFFFCNATRRSYEFKKQTGRNARLSETALTAASLVYSIQFLMIAVGVGTAVGLNSLLSRKIGEYKTEEACQAATTGLFLMLFTSIIFSFASIFLSDTIAFKMATDPELQTLCKQYLSINLVYCCGIFLQTYGQRLLQAVGDTVLSMISLIIGAILNIILDPIMIFGLFGWSRSALSIG